ncbi:class I lanthipeptide [uncultured Aquimarina sp.]|uniref:class I lanthipeptide n=1 Tax=uncultured Aquimarina sp. TaxID=575652 RepID=UPI002609434C|nr:class I lanthipeptide [uncultured Aquimarina sp.]
MKKKQIKRKLSFDKLTIAKLSNSAAIKGGSNNCTANGPIYTEGCMPSVDQCTLTVIGPTTGGGRPTEGQTRCNCEI